MTDLLFDRRRVGKFLLSVDVLEQGDIPQVFAGLGITIVRAEMLYHSNTIEYVGISPNFRVVKYGERPPYYTVVFHVDGEEISYEAKESREV
jgi:hypothetical protein